MPTYFSGQRGDQNPWLGQIYEFMCLLLLKDFWELMEENPHSYNLKLMYIIFFHFLIFFSDLCRILSYLKMGQSIGEADSPSDMTSCPFCCKDFSKNANLNKHLGKCKLLPASCRTPRKNSSQSDIKVYQVDKSLDLYVNTL